MIRSSVLLSLPLLVVVGCGGAPPPAQQTAYEGQSARKMEAAPAEASMMAPQSDHMSVEALDARFALELDETLTLSESSLRDCAGACRALQSLTRSAEAICSLTPAEEPRCLTARQKHQDASTRVLDRCGPCAPE